MNCQHNLITVKRLLLGWSVAVCFIALLTTCTKRVDRDFTPPPKQPREELVTKQIMIRIKAYGSTMQFRVRDEPIYASMALKAFYVHRLYRPAWINEQGPTRQVNVLVNALRRSNIEGLPPKNYHLATIETMLMALNTDIQKGFVIAPNRRAEFDLLLTDAFLVYVSPLLPGRVNPENLQKQCVSNERSVTLANVLKKALASNNIAGALGTPAPNQQCFRRLREGLVHYRELASKGGWPKIPDGSPLKRGNHGSRVAILRQRLILGGDLRTTNWEHPDVFDVTLDEALRRFQRRHGLKPDGIMSAATRAELNVSVERRVKQLELNLQRWRWLPQNLGRRYILVNIPAFKLEAVEDDTLALSMRIIVGKSDWCTPVLNNIIDHIILNPYWNVPRDMVAQEMRSRIMRDDSYLARRNIRVYNGFGPEAPEVDPKTVDWSAASSDNFPYRLRQDPGPFNGMGRVKFIFINKFNVYLHDTPGRYLFRKTQRAFSHGCIRIEQPIDLAVFLLRQEPHWNRDAFLLELKKKVNYSLMLPEPTPIYLVYWTAWADWDGTIKFCPDIYGWDAPLLGTIQAPLSTKEVDGIKNSGVHGG